MANKHEKILNITNCSVQLVSSVAHSCLTLCDPMNRSTPGLPVHHQLPESTQTHVHRVGDAIQPSHPLWSPSPPAPNPSQHQSLFLPGSSHNGSRVIRRGDGISVLGKNLFNYRYIERLETDSVVGNISGEKEAE